MNNARDKTRQIRIGTLSLGGGSPVAVQSMLNTRTADVTACLNQIDALRCQGCEIVRVAIPSSQHLAAFEQICALSPLPVVADVHFDYRLAVAASVQGAAKLRINPGNIGGFDRLNAVLDAAHAADIPIRIGVNAGSLAPRYQDDRRLSLAEKLVASALEFTEHCALRGFEQLVLSVKAASVPDTLAAYRSLSRELPEFPLHLGITEAGVSLAGTVKSAIGIGSLLEEGIGDTLRVSLTASPLEEARVGWEILSALELRQRHPYLISCPSCGRCEVDLIGIATKVEQRLKEVQLPVTVAVMGCVVNGPGEARRADVGVACGRGQGAIFKAGKVLYTVDESQIVEALLSEIASLSLAQTVEPN
ncbi:MAG: flavodoxin-dependent (E)-4-hydroxy-3-methylbut-2-enyl-diphosphate synthase [Coriobacteriales bacterium]|nr:flavodoxin-dependent (E)-4-hydroxy-3-methylbut-2-enyl-diphosphate synthase [Coriobacteriales bacterium]